MIRCLIPLVLWSQTAFADPTEVVAVKATQTGETWRFDVTLAHPDTGWDHYADGWEVTDMAGNRLGFRPLAHPHETEQPFTRSQSGIVIPEGTSQVKVRGRCNVDGWDTAFVVVDLPR